MKKFLKFVAIIGIVSIVAGFIVSLISTLKSEKKVDFLDEDFDDDKSDTLEGDF